jgi:protein-disulfide isomerase
MASSSPKGITLGIVALFVIAAGLFFYIGHNKQPAAPAAVTAAGQPAAETKTAPAVPASIEQAAATGLTDKTSEADMMAAKLPETPADTAKKDDAAKGDETETAATEAPAAEAAADKDAAPAAAADNGETAAAKDDDSAAAASSDTGGSLLSSPASLNVDIDKAEAERVIGKADAPVTIIEYASLTCPHCAHFDKEIFPKVKEQLIDTGKARLIFRDYPLDSFALKAAMMARCADPDKYFNLIDVIFKSQDRWIKAQDPIKALTQLGTLAGMDEKYINSCMNNSELESFILNGVSRAQGNYKVEATPTFVFNSGEEKFSGAQEVDEFVKTVNKLTAGN